MVGLSIGTVTDPAPWFRGRLNMRSGAYSAAYRNPVACFADRQGETSVVLVGSRYHLIGENKMPGLNIPMSSPNGVYELVRIGLNNEV